jgi:hypothetical protein
MTWQKYAGGKNNRKTVFLRYIKYEVRTEEQSFIRTLYLYLQSFQYHQHVL